MSNKKFNVKNGIVVGDTALANVSVHFDGTDAVQLPSGNTGQRPATANKGQIRYNSETNNLEGHDGSAWVNPNEHDAGTVAYATLDAAALEGNVATNSSSTIPTTVATKKYLDELEITYAMLNPTAVESNVAANTSSTIPTTPAVKAYADTNAGGGGAFEYMSTSTIASTVSSVTIQLNDANYTHYRIIGRDIQTNGSNASTGSIEVQLINGTTYIEFVDHVRYMYASNSTSTGARDDSDVNDEGSIQFNTFAGGGRANAGMTGMNAGQNVLVLDILNVPGSTRTSVFGETSGMNEASIWIGRTAGIANNATAVNNVEISTSDTNFTNAIFDVYGVRAS